MEFFKKIFKPSTEKTNIYSAELRDWFEEISKETLSDTLIDLRYQFSVIKELKQSLKANIKNLYIAVPENKISESEKHSFSISKESYLKKINLCLSSVQDEIIPFHELENLYTKSEKALDSFEKESQKNFYMLHNYFEKEMKVISVKIKSLQTELIKISEFLKLKNVKTYRSIISKIESLNSDIREQKKLESEIAGLTKENNSLNERKSKMGQKLESLKQTQGYIEFISIESQKKETHTQINALKQKFTVQIKEILASHKNLSNVALQTYIEDPLEALLKDNSSILLGLIEELKSSKLNDLKKQEKLLKVLEKLDSQYIDKIKKEYKKLIETETELSNRLQKSTFIMDQKEFQYQSEHLSEKINSISTNISDKNKQKHLLNIVQKTKKIEQEIYDFTGYYIEIEI